MGVDRWYGSPMQMLMHNFIPILAHSCIYILNPHFALCDVIFEWLLILFLVLYSCKAPNDVHWNTMLGKLWVQSSPLSKVLNKSGPCLNKELNTKTKQDSSGDLILAPIFREYVFLLDYFLQHAVYFWSTWMTSGVLLKT